MGHLSYTKGFYHLIEAYKILHSKYGNKISLYFAGEYKPSGKIISSYLINKEKEFYETHTSQIHSKIKEFIKNSKKYNAHYLGLINHKKKIENS